jgi:hypothetical protein
MEREGLPVINIMVDASKDPLPEASMASSSSGASSFTVASDVAEVVADVSLDLH